MSDYDIILQTEEQKKRQLLLLQAMERQRKRAQEIEDEETAQTEDADPFVMQARLADPAYYKDKYAVQPTTAAEKAEQMFFDMLSSGGSQGFASGSVSTSVYDQLGSLLSNFDKTEPS